MRFSSSSNQNKSRPMLLRIIGTVLAISVVIYLIWQNWNDFVTNLQRLHYSYILAVLGLAFFSRLMKTLRWFCLIKSVEKQITFWSVFKLSFVGLFTSNILPSTIGGDVVKFAGAINAGLNQNKVTASLILDRMIGMAAMVTFLPWGLVTTFEFHSLNKPPLYLGGGGVITQTWEKLRIYFNDTWIIIKQWSKHPTSLVIAAIISYFYSLSTFTIVYLILTGLGEKLTWWTAGRLWVMIYFITLIPISINGLGLQEASLSLIFVTYAGVSEPNSLVLAVLIRFVFIIASLPGAIFLPAAMARFRDTNTKFTISQ